MEMEAAKADDWRPEVVQSSSRVTVTFLTFSDLGQEAVYRHKDEYTAGTYKFEAHRKYVDIQCLLEGQENIESTVLNGLTVDMPYDAEKDVEFYAQTDNQKIVTHLMPGIFAAFFPQDAHMPGVSVGGSPAFVKKVVVKIKAELLKL